MENTIYMVDSYSQAEMIGLGVTFLILPIVAVCLRIWSRVLGHCGIKSDDILAILAGTFAAGCACVQLIAATQGNLGRHQKVDAEGEIVFNDSEFQVYEKCKFTVNLMSSIVLGFAKSSALMLYMNVFRCPKFRIAVLIVLGLVVSWTVAFFLANLLSCMPVSPFNLPVYGNKCIDVAAMWDGMVVSDSVIDVYMFFMPIPNVLMLKLPRKQKYGILLVFLLGASVVAFSITRVLVYYHVGSYTIVSHPTDETYYVAPVFFWNIIEASVAVLCISLPTYGPLWLFLKGDLKSRSKAHRTPSSYAEILDHNLRKKVDESGSETHSDVSKNPDSAWVNKELEEDRREICIRVEKTFSTEITKREDA